MKQIIYIFVALFLLSSCKTTQTTANTNNESEKTRIEYRDRLTHDTIYVHDVERVFQRGDTIYKDVTKYKYIERIKIDTAYILQTDTIVKTEYTEEIKVVQSNKYTILFYSLLWLIFVYLIYRLYKWASKIV